MLVFNVIEYSKILPLLQTLLLEKERKTKQPSSNNFTHHHIRRQFVGISCRLKISFFVKYHKTLCVPYGHNDFSRYTLFLSSL
ncbi:hypothetical protein D1872_174150 [compost metagenome]